MRKEDHVDKQSCVPADKIVCLGYDVQGCPSGRYGDRRSTDQDSEEELEHYMGI